MVKGASAPRKASRIRSTVLRLDGDVYSEAALERARGAFAHLATIEIRSRGGQWTIRFSRVRLGLADRLADEFANHALSCLLVDR
jgi:hypothetical protein